MAQNHKKVEIHKYDGEDYVVDYNQLVVWRLDEGDDFSNYKAALRNPNMSNKINKPSEKFLRMLEKHSKVYDPEIHKFKGEK